MILAPTLSLSSGSGAALVRPTFSRDFAGEKTLNNGTGPAITFTRASDATYFDANGTLQTATSDTPRFDHSGGNSLGLLIEEARTNSIRNSQAGGAAAGTLPTHWTATATANNVTRTIIGGGTENGLSYLDIQYAGTPTASGSVTIGFDSTQQIVAADTQTWTNSVYVKLQAGSFTNASYGIGVQGMTAAGASVVGQFTNNTTLPTGDPLISQRRSVTRTMSSASVERVFPYLFIGYTSGNPIDLTLRIAAPQLEQGAFPTSYIPTTSAAATRAADSAVVTPISSFYNEAEGTLFAEGSANTSTTLPSLVSLDDTTADERMQIRRNQTTSQGFFTVIDGGVSQTGILTGSWTTSTQIVRMAAAYKANDFAASFNGGSVGTDTSGTVPTPTQMDIGGGINAGRLNAHIRKIAYWPKRLTNTLLEQLTT